MERTRNQTKDAWNKAHYKQVKVSAPIDVAEKFKAECSAEGVSMASVLVECMKRGPNVEMRAQDLVNRRLRRKEVGLLMARLQKVLDAEEGYRDRIPEGLNLSARYEEAERAVEALTEVIQLLGEVYP
jgi:hypothetical protein